MEEWQAHIRNDATGRAWCGVELGWEFAFQGPDHAARAARRSRLQPCPACAEAVARGGPDKAERGEETCERS